MPNEKRRKRDRERRRNEIIDAAERLFFSKGYDVITMDDIAADAGLAKGTLYTYFKSKESLFYAVALRGVRLLNTLFAGAVKMEKVGVDKIYSTGVAYYEFSKRYPEYFKLFSYAESERFVCRNDENALKLTKVNQDNLNIMLESIRIGQEDGSILPGLDPLMTAIFLMESTNAMIPIPGFHETLYQNGKDTDEVMRFTLERLKRSIENTPK
ncbi:MAG: TetR/AcrR family transcriptional regulator [Halobacteriota archaeon]|jgi:AcrR family transcriptional regulator